MVVVLANGGSVGWDVFSIEDWVAPDWNWLVAVRGGEGPSEEYSWGEWE